MKSHGKIHLKIHSMLNFKIGDALALQVRYRSLDIKIRD